jgi:hypothetical protein
LALYHYKTNAGAKKVLAAIRLRYYWKNMEQMLKARAVYCVI